MSLKLTEPNVRITPKLMDHAIVTVTITVSADTASCFGGSGRYFLWWGHSRKSEPMYDLNIVSTKKSICLELRITLNKNSCSPDVYALKSGRDFKNKGEKMKMISLIPVLKFTRRKNYIFFSPHFSKIPTLENLRRARST